MAGEIAISVGFSAASALIDSAQPFQHISSPTCGGWG